MSRNTVVGSLRHAEGRVVGYVKRQFDELSNGGFPALLRKGQSLLFKSLAISVVLLVRAIKPLILIRFGSLGSERIGHFAANTELCLCERDAGIQGGRTFAIFYHDSQISNQQLKIMWDRTLPVWQFASVVARLNRVLPGGRIHEVPQGAEMDIHSLLPRTKVHLSFTPEEEERGREGLRKLGVPEEKPFVCFNARDKAYLDRMLPGKNWDYHDYRNSSIQNFLPAAEHLVRRGYYVIRMGAVVTDKLPSTDSRIIDYATQGRSDFLDIYLGAKCRFFLGDTAGIFAIPKIFRKPIVGVNVIPLTHGAGYGVNDLFIPKKLWLRAERRFLTFREMLRCGVDKWDNTRMYTQAGIETIENTADEILAAANEMFGRLEGKRTPQDDDDELQERFWALFPLDHPFRRCPSRPRIGAEFLRQNRDLLA